MDTNDFRYRLKIVDIQIVTPHIIRIVISRIIVPVKYLIRRSGYVLCNIVSSGDIASTRSGFSINVNCVSVAIKAINEIVKIVSQCKSERLVFMFDAESRFQICGIYIIITLY